MPIYEYRCQDCGRVSSFFVRSINSEVIAVCSHCGSSNMARRMSSFAMGKTVASVHEQFAPAANTARRSITRTPATLAATSRPLSTNSAWRCPSQCATT